MLEELWDALGGHPSEVPVLEWQKWELEGRYQDELEPKVEKSHPATSADGTSRLPGRLSRSNPFAVGASMYLTRLKRVSEIALVVGAPLLLAVVELFHPHPHDLLTLDVHTWLWVHYAQIPLFPLSALAIATLVRDRADVAATLCRIAMFVFAVSYTALDTAAGVVTGILVKAAHESGTPEAWRAPIEAIWKHPIMGGSIPTPFLAILGSIALSGGSTAAAVSLKRAGCPWAPAILLALSSFGIGIFKTHAWPGGPLTFGGLALASGWLLWERYRVKGNQNHVSPRPSG